MSKREHDRHYDRDHDQDRELGEDGTPLTETQLRVRALESLLVEKGFVDPAARRLRPRNNGRPMKCNAIWPPVSFFMNTGGGKH